MEDVKTLKEVINQIREPNIDYPKRTTTLEEHIAIQIYDIRHILKNKIDRDFMSYEKRDNGWDTLMSVLDQKFDTIFDMLKTCNSDEWERILNKNKGEINERTN